MDYSLISAAAGAISAAIDLGKTAAGISNINKLSPTVAQLNTQLLKAQESLFALRGQLDAMNDELLQSKAALIQAQQEIAEIKQQKLQLDQYERFSHPAGGWAYRLKGAQPDEVDAPAYCPACFEQQKLSLLHPGSRPHHSYLIREAVRARLRHPQRIVAADTHHATSADGAGDARFSFVLLNTSGRASCRYIRRARGMPEWRHSDTDGGRIPKMSATAAVPPRRSITAEESMFLSMRHIRHT